jgi:phospholipid/cholesterol/gamma-HCH transport system ATP-binding protein
MPSTDPIIAKDLEISYGDKIIQRDLNFAVQSGEIFVLMGGSGCGKTTVMRSLTGLKAPSKGQVFLDGVSFWESEQTARDQLARNIGVVYQSGALWSSMTLAENVALPLNEFTDLPPREIGDLVALKLSLVGLAGFGDYYPSQISGGMRKRAGVARALALDPKLLFFDEPSAGLDPITSSLLDELILELRESLGTTMVLVTHELPSIFSVADNCVFLDAETHTMIAIGDPRRLKEESQNPKVQAFLNRGGKNRTG